MADGKEQQAAGVLSVESGLARDKRSIGKEMWESGQRAKDESCEEIEYM